jgi:hypothetical protein
VFEDVLDNVELALLGMGLIVIAGITAARLRQSIVPANHISTPPGG